MLGEQQWMVERGVKGASQKIIYEYEMLLTEETGK